MNADKPYIRTEITIASGDQILYIQPGVGDGYIEMYFKDSEDDKDSDLIYINKTELPVIIQKLQEMMNYTLEV